VGVMVAVVTAAMTAAAMVTVAMVVALAIVKVVAVLVLCRAGREVRLEKAGAMAVGMAAAAMAASMAASMVAAVPAAVKAVTCSQEQVEAPAVERRDWVAVRSVVRVVAVTNQYTSSPSSDRCHTSTACPSSAMCSSQWQTLS
jgi:hypothetical protein